MREDSAIRSGLSFLRPAARPPFQCDRSEPRGARSCATESPSIAASKLFRIIISEASVTEVGEISLRKTEMVGSVQAGRTVNSWKDEKRWGGFSAPRAEGGAGTSRAGPVWSERLWEGGRGATLPRDGADLSVARVFCVWGTAQPPPEKRHYSTTVGAELTSPGTNPKKTACVSRSYGPTSADCAILSPAMSKQFNLRLSLELRGCRSAERACV